MENLEWKFDEKKIPLAMINDSCFTYILWGVGHMVGLRSDDGTGQGYLNQHQRWPFQSILQNTDIQKQQWVGGGLNKEERTHSLCMTQCDQTRERDNGCLMSCLASCRSARSVPKSFTNQVRDWINHIFYINRFTVQIVWLDIIYNANQSRTN